MENNAYDYMNAVHNDFTDSIDEMRYNGLDGFTAEDVRNEYDSAITGNDNGSYTCDRVKAEGYVKSFIFGPEWEDFIDYINSSDYVDTLKDAEKMDVLIRSYILDRNYEDWFDEYMEDIQL